MIVELTNLCIKIWRFDSLLCNHSYCSFVNILTYIIFIIVYCPVMIISDTDHILLGWKSWLTSFPSVFGFHFILLFWLKVFKNQILLLSFSSSYFISYHVLLTLVKLNFTISSASCHIKNTLMHPNLKTQIYVALLKKVNHMSYRSLHFWNCWILPSVINASLKTDGL